MICMYQEPSPMKELVVVLGWLVVSAMWSHSHPSKVEVENIGLVFRQNRTDHEGYLLLLCNAKKVLLLE